MRKFDLLFEKFLGSRKYGRKPYTGRTVQPLNVRKVGKLQGLWQYEHLLFIRNLFILRISGFLTLYAS
jgi:hypothetical protein